MRSRRLAPLLALLVVLLTVVGAPRASSTGTDEEPATDYGRMLLLLDSSGSMAEPAAGGATKIEAAKQALGEVIGSLPDDAFVGLRVYGAEVFSRSQPGACTDTQLVVPPGTDNRDELAAAVADYTPYGETPIGYSLRQAAKDIGGEGTRSVVLVSDGVATCEPDPCDVAAELAEQGIDLQIDVVGLSVDAQARSQLRCIAAAGNGTYYDAGSADEIVESLTTASERAIRPFELDGTPVTGGPDELSAVPLEPGRYVDRVARAGGQDERWYRYERVYDGSTVVVSTYELVVGSQARLSLDVRTEEGEPCPPGYDAVIFPIATTDQATVSGTDPEVDEGCRSGPLLIRVGSYDDEGGREFGLGIIEEPAPVNAEDLPPGFDDADRETLPETAFERPRTSGAPQPVVAGSTFADATSLESGVAHTSTAVADEVQSYRVRVGWGQKLAVRLVRTDDAGGASVVDDSVQVLNPSRMSVSDDPRTDDYLLGRTDEGTLPVRWASRDTGPGSYLAGDYYVLVTLGNEPDDATEYPYRLDVEVQGEEGGAPSYADGESLLGLGGTDAGGEEEAATAEAEPRGSAEQGGSTPVLMVGALVLVALLCAGVGIRLLRAR